MNRKSLLIVFLLCAIVGLLLIVAGGISLVPRKWFAIALMGAGIIFLFLCWSLQNVLLKKQREATIASLDNLGNAAMSLERFCKIAEALSNSDTVVDCTLGDAITWEDIFFAIDEHGDNVSQETGIASDELRQWKKEAILNHAEYYPFTAEQA